MPTTTTANDLQHRITEIEAELAAAGVPPVATAEQAGPLALGLNCVRTVHRMIERGDLRGLKIGNRWRIRRRELAAFIARRER